MAKYVLTAVNQQNSRLKADEKNSAQKNADGNGGNSIRRRLIKKKRPSIIWSVHTVAKNLFHTETRTENIAVITAMYTIDFGKRKKEEYEKINGMENPSCFGLEACGI